MKWLFISETQDVHTSAEARKSGILTVLFIKKNCLVEPKKGKEEKNGKIGFRNCEILDVLQIEMWKQGYLCVNSEDFALQVNRMEEAMK